MNQKTCVTSNVDCQLTLGTYSLKNSNTQYFRLRFSITLCYCDAIHFHVFFQSQNYYQRKTSCLGQLEQC